MKLRYVNGISKGPDGKYRVARRDVDGSIAKGVFFTEGDAKVFRTTIDRRRLRRRIGLELADDAPMSLKEAMDEYIFDAEARGLAEISVRTLKANRKILLDHFDGDQRVILGRRDIDV